MDLDKAEWNEWGLRERKESEMMGFLAGPVGG